MKDKAIEDAMNSIENRIRHVYNQGYNDGIEFSNEAHACTGDYERGLNDAWECARKMNQFNPDNNKQLCDELFDMYFTEFVSTVSPSEAIAKLKEYEEKQKRTCDTCQYLHGGFNSLKKCANCYGNNGWTPKKMTLDEAIKHCEEVADSKCDECGAEHRQLAEWLKELKELKEEERREEDDDTDT